ncbi:unnamed protein product [Rhizophagus irregularis]|nr:unnamed protein product [Rhizophagus irregularis]
MTGSRKNKASGTPAPKRPAQSPPSGNVQGQGSSTSTPVSTSQPSTDSSNKRTRVSSEPVMDQDNILTPPAPQDTTSTSSPPPVDTNASPSAPDSGASLEDSQHFPSNSANKGKSVEITPPEPERVASPDASTAAIQSSPFAFMLRLRPLLSKDFGTTLKPIARLATRLIENSPPMPLMVVRPPLKDAQLRGAFSRYGIVIHCRTRLSKLYRTAYIIFDSVSSLAQFKNTWAVLCTGHCLCVCPASHSSDQRAIRRAHVALLAGLLRGSVAADLNEIAEEISAKSINIHEPAEVSSLCHRCGRPGCDPDKCASSRAPHRPSRPWSSNDKLCELYNKHLPLSHPAKRHNRFARPPNSQQRSYADAAGRRAPSRSRSRPKSSHSRSRHIAQLTADFSELQSRVKWLEENRGQSVVPLPQSSVPMDQGWDAAASPNSRLLSDNILVDLNSHLPPPDDTFSIARSYVPLPPRQSLIPGLSSSPEHRLSSLTATVTELIRTVKQGMAQQQQFLAARDNANNHYYSFIPFLFTFSIIVAKFIFKNEHHQHHFRSYWACSSSSRPHDGVGVLLRNSLHKHVQLVDPWNGRLLKLDLFFHQTKISIISLYYPPSGSIHQNICNDLIAKLLSWLDHARSNNYHVIILGDFNIDEIAHSTYSHNHFRLLCLLSSRYFNDHQARSSLMTGPDPTFYYTNGSSRLDYIWSSPGFPALGVFTQVVTCPFLFDRPFTDHRVLITTFDFSSYRLWHALKAAIFNSAVQTLPHQHVSNTHRYSYSSELTKLIAINKSLDRFLYRLTTHRPNRPTQISQMTAALPSHLANLATLLPDYSVPVYSTTPLSGFKSFLRSQKNLVSAFLSTKFAQQLTDSVEYYTALRDEHFSDSPGKFIDSALSVEKRSIVLDRVLVVLNSQPTLLTDPSDIKQAAIAHFQSVVSPPLVHYSSPASFPPRWQKAYTPLLTVSASLYDPVLAPITLQEWSDIISSMPNNKASGPSKISYEMLKHLSGDTLEFSLLLANTCLSRGDIPADWREAVIYPIPKPHDFDAQLKNTRPITLLETVRKCVVKVVTNRLSNILADNNVL